MIKVQNIILIFLVLSSFLSCGLHSKPKESTSNALGGEMGAVRNLSEIEAKDALSFCDALRDKKANARARFLGRTFRYSLSQDSCKDSQIIKSQVDGNIASDLSFILSFPSTLSYFKNEEGPDGIFKGLCDNLDSKNLKKPLSNSEMARGGSLGQMRQFSFARAGGQLRGKVSTGNPSSNAKGIFMKVVNTKEYTIYLDQSVCSYCVGLVSSYEENTLCPNSSTNSSTKNQEKLTIILAGVK